MPPRYLGPPAGFDRGIAEGPPSDWKRYQRLSSADWNGGNRFTGDPRFLGPPAGRPGGAPGYLGPPGTTTGYPGGNASYTTPGLSGDQRYTPPDRPMGSGAMPPAPYGGPKMGAYNQDRDFNWLSRYGGRGMGGYNNSPGLNGISPYGGQEMGSYAPGRDFNWLARLFGGYGQGAAPGYDENFLGALLGGANLGRGGF